MTAVLTYLRIYARILVSILSGRPYKLSLLVSSGCDLRCRICSIWQNQPVSLAPSEVRTIWESLSPRPAWINISGGEPMSNGDLEEILRFFVDQRRPLLITLTTNGQIDCAPLVQRVMQGNSTCVLYVSVSLDGEPREHDRARGRPGAFARSIATYQHLRDLQAGFPRLKVGASVTVSRFNLPTVWPFLQRMLREQPATTIILSQASDYYRNSAASSFRELPSEDLVDLLVKAQRALPKLSPDSLLKVLYLEQAIRHLRGSYSPVPCTSYLHNVLVDADLTLLDCTFRFHAWTGRGGSREARLAALAQALRYPAARRAALREDVKASGCEQECHTPCEKYLHLIAALLSPRHALPLLWTYLRICLASTWPRGVRSTMPASTQAASGSRAS